MRSDPRWPLFVRIADIASKMGITKPGSGYLLECDPRPGQENWIRLWDATGKCVSAFDVRDTWTDEAIRHELPLVKP